MTGHPSMASYLVDGLLPLALFAPIYRAEYVLVFVLGMTVTFGVLLPTAFGSIVALVAAVLYRGVRAVLFRIRAH
jgi:hypothetical protein